MGIKIGICCDTKELGMYEQMGFDYIEANLANLMQLDAGEVGAIAEQASRCRIGIEATNVFFPGTATLSGPSADAAANKAYIARAVERATSVGAKAIVFGSGKARATPDGFDPAAARAQVRALAAYAGEEAEKRGATIVFEPLNATETNFVNSVTEGAAFVKETACSGLRLLADFYHMRVMNEPMSALTGADAGALLMHTHIARGEGRTYPLPGAEDCYLEFFAALKAIGYTGRVSIEGNSDDKAADGPKSLAYLRALAAEAGF